jgi:tetratricopeptide (TPR) repeat protein
VGYAREATAAYDLYLKSYPDDYTQRYNYGNELRDNRQYEEAIKQYSEVLRAVPDHASSHINLAVSLVALDRSAEALEHYDRAFVLEPDWITSGVLNHEYGFTLIKAGNEQKARQVFDKALAKPATKAAGLRSIALLELTHGRYAEAKTRLTEAILDHAAANRTLSKARDHAHLAIVLDGMGDARGNQRELDLAAALMAKMPEQLWMGATIGARLARAGAAGKAAGLEKAMASHVDQKSDNDRSSLHRLQAEIALAQGNRPKSIELFQLAHRESDSSLTLEGLAFASAQAGQVDEAIARYEALIRARDRSMGWEPQQSWYDAHYRLASLYAGRGNAARARELLTALLTYWKDADPDLPLVLRARRLQEQISR